MSSFGITFAVFGIAEDTVSQIALDQEIFKIFEWASNLGSLRLKETFILFVIEVIGSIALPLPIWNHEFTYVSFLEQVEETGLKLEKLLKLRLWDKALQVVLAVAI